MLNIIRGLAALSHTVMIMLIAAFRCPPPRPMNLQYSFGKKVIGFLKSIFERSFRLVPILSPIVPPRIMVVRYFQCIWENPVPRHAGSIFGV
ncbi:MAG: hypothetical protein WBX81_02550, partial [Nitrososphaeraceae archaeon]